MAAPKDGLGRVLLPSLLCRLHQHPQGTPQNIPGNSPTRLQFLPKMLAPSLYMEDRQKQPKTKQTETKARKRDVKTARLKESKGAPGRHREGPAVGKE